jgi:hypothetical protein
MDQPPIPANLYDSSIQTIFDIKLSMPVSNHIMFFQVYKHNAETLDVHTLQVDPYKLFPINHHSQKHFLCPSETISIVSLQPMQS